MTMDLILGLLVTAVPAFVVGYLMLNKMAPIFRMFLAMMGLGIGYLYATGALEDIGAKVQGKDALPPIAAPAPAAAKPEAAAPAETKTAPAADAQPTQTEAAPAATDETKTEPAATEAPTATDAKPATQADPYPGAPKPAQ